MSIGNLKTGSLAGKVEANHKEFRAFALFVQKFVNLTQQRFRDVQGSFAEALLNHETRIKELEKALAVTPNQELQTELENLIVENAKISNKMEEQHKLDNEPELPGMPETPAKLESKVMYHKEFNEEEDTSKQA